jgi:hypothetical protein
MSFVVHGHGKQASMTVFLNLEYAGEYWRHPDSEESSSIPLETSHTLWAGLTKHSDILDRIKEITVGGSTERVPFSLRIRV